MQRLTLTIAMILSIVMDVFSDDTILKFIFVPHARTENSTGDLVIKGIQNIDFSKFALKMLGGDLAVSTTKDSATMAYCDKIFDLKNVNTLWAVGNHDVESGNKALITKFTNRSTYYSYARNGVQFLILDTELDATSFSGTSITGAQLDTVKAVCNRITSADTKFLIILNSRYVWMVGNPDFTQAFKDSNIAASSKSMTTCNFSKDVYPLLQAVKAKGIQPMWFSGDKARTNVNNYIYNHADSIPFYAAKMENSDPDSTNYVVILSYTKNKKIQCDYVKLTHVNSWVTGVLPKSEPSFENSTAKETFLVRQTLAKREITLSLQNANNVRGLIRIFGTNGAVYYSKEAAMNHPLTIHLNKAGVYIAQAIAGNSIHVKKIIVR
jgi:hypothetical protein